MQIHVDRGGERFGPYSLEEVNRYLADGTLMPSDIGWHEGATDWVPLTQIAGVKAGGGSPSSPGPPAPTAADAAGASPASGPPAAPTAADAAQPKAPQGTEGAAPESGTRPPHIPGVLGRGLNRDARGHAVLFVQPRCVGP